MPPLPRLAGPSLNDASNAAASIGVTVTSNASANTKGAWVELVASTAGDVAWLLAQLCVTGAVGKQFACDIGVGAAGSEVVVVPDLYCSVQSTTGFIERPYVIPLNIPAGSRISARCQDNVGGGSLTIALQTLAPGAAGIGGCGRVEACGVVTSGATRLTLVNLGTVAHTDSGWQELIAATSFDYRWLTLAIAHDDNTAAAQTTWLVDLATGGSGSEVAVLNDVNAKSSSTLDVANFTMSFPFSVASGSRISARARSENTAADDANVNVAVWGCG